MSETCAVTSWAIELGKKGRDWLTWAGADPGKIPDEKTVQELYLLEEPRQWRRLQHLTTSGPPDYCG